MFRVKNWCFGMAAALGLASAAGSVLAQTEISPPESGAGEVRAASSDVEKLTQWADNYFTAKLDDDKAFAGVGVTIVSANSDPVYLTYGLASAQGDAIDPAQTRFPIGSLSKTFVGLAVAKLVEDGVIKSIDDPANTYLTSMVLPDWNGQQITIKDLLTHSAGLDFTNRGLGQPKGGTLQTAISNPAAKLTPLVRKPGSLISYSNVGTGVLGVMVEDLVGTPIEEYYNQKIWNAIGLKDARFHTEVDYNPDTVQPFRYTEVGKEPRYFITFDPYYYSVGAVELTLEDAARYAQFHLKGALGQPNGLLEPAMLAKVQSRLKANNPGVGGFGFQTMNFPWGSHTIIAHGGTWPAFESMLVVVPDREIAVFFSISGPSGMSNIDTTNVLLGELLGAPDPLQPPVEASLEELKDYEGVYYFTLQASRGIEKILRLVSPQSVKVKATPEGLMIGDQGPFKKVGDDLFWTPEPSLSATNIFGAGTFGFTRDEAGRVTAITQQHGLAPRTRIASWRDPADWAQYLQFAVFALITGFVAIFWPKASKVPAGSRAAAIIAAGAPLLFVPTLTAMHGPGGIEAYIIEGHAARFWLAGLLALVTALACLAIIYFTIRAWAGHGKKEGANWPRYHLTLLAPAAGVALASLATILI